MIPLESVNSQLNRPSTYRISHLAENETSSATNGSTTRNRRQRSEGRSHRASATPLKTKIDRIEQYDIVFLGFPTWGMRLPPPIKSFLHQYSLNGKTVIPFNTNAGYGVGSAFQTVRELCRQCNVLEGFTTRGGVERDGQYLVIKGTRAEEARMEVDTWLKKIGVTTTPAPSRSRTGQATMRVMMLGAAPR